MREADSFIRQFYKENRLSEVEQRLREIEREVAHTGTYIHTKEELQYGAQLAWRNSNRCIGRLFWQTLQVQDCRKVTSEAEFIQALEKHLHTAGQGKIRNVISIFPPQSVRTKSGFSILNYTLLQYAGYRTNKGEFIGDPKHIEFTEFCQSLGWQGRGTAFDLLPVVFRKPSGAFGFHQLPESLTEEIKINHPDYPWFDEIGLKWYKLPVISNQTLEIGGISYPCAPFNGWYMVNEIATRNFADEDRYDLIPLIAKKMGLDARSPFRKDKALVVLNEAVYHSFRTAGAMIVDHHTACKQFMQFVEEEQKAGREVTGDWTWLVPPNAGSLSPVFHREWKNEVKKPNFFAQQEDIDFKSVPKPRGKCPFAGV